MGNTLTALVSYFVAFYFKLSEKSKAILWGEQKQKNYFNNDILLKDDEQKAGNFVNFINIDILSSEEINKMLEKQRIMKKNQNNSINEYKIIKNTHDMDDIEGNVNKKGTELQKKEIQEIHKEVQNINFGDDHEMEDNNDNIEDLKSAILNTNDDG